MRVALYAGTSVRLARERVLLMKYPAQSVMARVVSLTHRASMNTKITTRVTKPQMINKEIK